MKNWELIQKLNQYPAGLEVSVSQKPQGFVVGIEYVFRDGATVKIHGDGAISAEGPKQIRQEDSK